MHEKVLARKDICYANSSLSPKILEDARKEVDLLTHLHDEKNLQYQTMSASTDHIVKVFGYENFWEQGTFSIYLEYCPAGALGRTMAEMIPILKARSTP